MDQPCGKRMKPVLRIRLESMEKNAGEPMPTMPEISAASLDRVWRCFKMQEPQERESPLQLTHLKKSIPYVDRTATISAPGLLSEDTVFHCYGDMLGDFVWTLTVTDELTGRTHTSLSE